MSAHGTRVGDRPGESATADPVALLEREAPGLLGYFVRRVHDREDAADLLADLLTVAWRRRGSIPADPTAARMWLYGVARKTLARHRRGVGRRVALAERLRSELAAHPVRVDDEQAVALRGLVAGLPPIDREIISLSYWEGFTLVEVGRLLGMPAATVRSRHARAKARLRAQLDDDPAAPPPGRRPAHPR